MIGHVMHAHNVTCIQYRHQNDKQTWTDAVCLLTIELSDDRVLVFERKKNEIKVICSAVAVKLRQSCSF